MRPFNLKEAKAGKPVCTADGKAVRILAFDAKSKDFPIIALVSIYDNIEMVATYTNAGRHTLLKESNNDLRMVETKCTGYMIINHGKPVLTPDTYIKGTIYPSRKLAEEMLDCISSLNNDDCNLYIGKVTWEE